MIIRHPASRGSGRRGRFAQFSEVASNFTSSLTFYVICLMLVGVFIGVHIAHLSLEWQHLAGDAMASVTLLLLALLKNSERRAEHAIQRKLDAIAAALLADHKGESGKAFEDLEEAIRMEEET